MRLAVAALLSLASCGVNLLDPVGDANRRYSAFAASAISQARARCGDDQVCFKATANALYARSVARDRAEWDAIGPIASPVAPVVAPRPMVAMPYVSSAPSVPVPDVCGMMSCPRAPPPPVRFIPYTEGGGNPSGYGLLAR